MPPKFNSIDRVNQPSEEREIYRKQGEDFVDAHKRLLHSFAEDVSLKFKMGNQFLIDYEQGTVQLDSQWFFERGYNKEQILWAVFHELSHFKDFSNDKEGMLASFEYMKQKAEDLSNESGMDPQLAYRTYHALFNCLDDIYVNRTVSRHASYYESNRQGGAHVEELYREKLFKEADFTNIVHEDGTTSSLPHHLQFAYYLLRKAMLPEEEITVSQEVRDLLEKEVEIEGNVYSTESLVNTLMVPGREDVSVSERHEYVKEHIMPLYEELLQRDINNNEEPPQQQENDDTSSSGEESTEDNEQDSEGQSNQEEQGVSQEQEASEAGASDDQVDQGEKAEQSQSERQRGKFEEWSDIHEQYESQSPDQLAEDEIREVVERREEEKAEDDQDEVPEKIESRDVNSYRDSIDKNWAAQHEIEGRDIYRELQNLREIEDSIAPYLNDLTELWQNIITGSSIEITQVKDNAHTSGSGINIDSIIDNMGSLYAGHTAPRIYEKTVQKESVVEKPEVIRVRLVVDRSGSMYDDEKQEVLSQALVLVLRSLQQFNEILDLTRGTTGSKLKAETQVLGFSDRLSIIKELENEGYLSDPTIDILNALRSSGAENGRTYDHLALDYVLQNQDELNQQRIAQGKVLDILFEITDGGSSDAGATRDSLKNVGEVGVHANAFQIGRVGRDETRAFNYAWNSEEQDKRGLVVGENIEAIVPVLAEALKRYLGGVKI